jgi:hypothetical protein
MATRVVDHLQWPKFSDYLFLLWPLRVADPLLTKWGWLIYPQGPWGGLATTKIFFKSLNFFLKQLRQHWCDDSHGIWDRCYNFKCVMCRCRRNLLVLEVKMDGGTIFVFSNSLGTTYDKKWSTMEQKIKIWNHMEL